MHDFFNAVVVIMLVVGFIWLRSVKHRPARSDDRLFSSGSFETREAELEHEVAELRNRIAVLERIATDDRKSRQIAAEIDALRD